MVTNPITIGKIVTKLPVKTLPKIEGNLSYEAINKLIKLLYANA